jgi:hypothetical protein
MTIRQWIKSFGQSVIDCEGRGEACLEPCGDGIYVATMTDCELAADIVPGESREQLNARLAERFAESTFSGRDDIELVVEWFANQVCYSPADKEQILANWRGKFRDSNFRGVAG